jgi:type 1 glutamine amidotransferase
MFTIRAILAGTIFASFSAWAFAADPWVVYEGKEGPGKGKHIVLIAGDDEYRSEELIPQMAKILAVRHGFKCTVLFAIDRNTGEINPSDMENIPGLQQLRTADLMVMFMRFRDLPDDQMKEIIDYANSGRPIVALRTSTHSFNLAKHKNGPYAKWTWNNRGEFAGGFGRQVLGETWINHYGAHQKESTRGVIAPGMENHPILRGVADIWGPSDVYEVTTLNGDCKPLVLGQVLTGMNPTDPPNTKKKELPVAWTKTWTGSEGKASRIFTTTMGHVDDLRSEGFRRLLVNACYWAMGMEGQIPAKSNVDMVGTYETSKIHHDLHRKGVKPEDLKLPD